MWRTGDSTFFVWYNDLEKNFYFENNPIKEGKSVKSKARSEKLLESQGWRSSSRYHGGWKRKTLKIYGNHSGETFAFSTSPSSLLHFQYSFSSTRKCRQKIYFSCSFPCFLQHFQFWFLVKWLNLEYSFRFGCHIFFVE